MTTEQPVRRPRGLRGAQWALVVASVLLAIAGVIALSLTAPTVARATDPEAPVRAYLQALVDGKVAAALRDAGVTRGADDVLLTDAAFRHATDRLSSFTVLGAQTSGGHGTVRVGLHQGDLSYVTSLDIERPSGGLSFLLPWKLSAQRLAHLSVQVHGPDELAVTIAGVKVSAPKGTIELAALPGTYGVTASDGLYAAPDQQATVLIGGVEPPQVTLSAVLQPSGVSAVQSAVEAWLSGCAGSSDLSPDGCPFRAIPTAGVDYTDGKWTIDRAPVIAEGSWSDQLGGWPVRTTSDGMVTFSARASSGSASGTATTGSKPFDVVGTVVGDAQAGIRFVPSPSYSAGAAGPSV